MEQSERERESDRKNTIGRVKICWTNAV